jgi:hypothetical protein
MRSGPPASEAFMDMVVNAGPPPPGLPKGVAGLNGSESEPSAEPEPQAASGGARKGGGRGGKQRRLNELADDPKVSSADRGWL